MTKKQAIVFDVDGTVALRDKGPDGRSPYDMDRVGEDLPNIPILTVAKLLHNNINLQIIFLSGRSEAGRHQTLLWLDHHFGHTDYKLYTRDKGDLRPDHVFKQEFVVWLQLFWDVIAVFDDRNSVVDMWRREGFTCFQVCSREEGDF